VKNAGETGYTNTAKFGESLSAHVAALGAVLWMLAINCVADLERRGVERGAKGLRAQILLRSLSCIIQHSQQWGLHVKDSDIPYYT
jgi:hypothetical protein